MGQKIALGKAAGTAVIGVIAQPTTTEERLALMESKLKAMTHAFYSIRKILANKDTIPDGDAYIAPGPATNRDGIPFGIVLMGITTTAPFICTVGDDGRYWVNNMPFDSLSAAAAAVGAPQRKSGWRFWRTLDGRAVKEVFKRI